MYSTRAFWKKRPTGQVYHKGRNVTLRHRRNVTSQTPVVSMTTRLIYRCNVRLLKLFLTSMHIQLALCRLINKVNQAYFLAACQIESGKATNMIDLIKL